VILENVSVTPLFDTNEITHPHP